MAPLWTTRQRKALWALLICFWLALAVRWTFNRVYLSDAPDAAAPRSAELADRIDPNVCDWQTLAAIPTLGEKRAQAIVAYREKSIAAGHGPIVFHAISDLTHVKGVGPSTIENIEPFLMFPQSEKPVTEPQ